MVQFTRLAQPTVIKCFRGLWFSASKYFNGGYFMPCENHEEQGVNVCACILSKSFKPILHCDTRIFRLHLFQL